MGATSSLNLAAAVRALVALAIGGGLTIPSQICVPATVPCAAMEPPGFLQNPGLLETALRVFQQLLFLQFPMEAERHAAEALIDLAASGPEDNGTPQEGTASAATGRETDAESNMEATAARLIDIVSDLLALEEATAAASSEETKKTTLSGPQDLESFVAHKKASRDRHAKTAEAYWLYAQLRKHVSAPDDMSKYTS